MSSPHHRAAVARSSARALALLGAALVALAVFAAPRAASAQQPPTATPESWAGQLESLARWLGQRERPAHCDDHCYTLQRLALTGSLASGTLNFELNGGVLAEGPVAVPLLGPPGQVRLDAVTEDGQPAQVGFESDHYYVFTSHRRFVIRGTLTFLGDRALTIPGPLNALSAEISGGRVVEGNQLAGLAGATVHLDDGAAAARANGAEPTVFQLSRALRVQREITFTYRLVMRSGSDLGVVRLPLAMGEQVLDVSGSQGWRTEGRDLILPTSGHSADVTITGSLPRLDAGTPDGRSTYEWWLLESDPEHRLTITGDARQMDVSQSPIAASQANARLYLVQRGQRLQTAVQTLSTVSALAAVVSSARSTVVLTRRGDLILDDWLNYQNNGNDYLALRTEGRPIFLATDGSAERLMRQGEDAPEVMVPLQTGAHTVHAQSLTRTSLGLFGGALHIPVNTHPLAESRAEVSLGLPRFVHPLALLGGDRAQWFVRGLDLIAMGLALALALAVLRGRARRTLGTLALAGLWFVSEALFVAAVMSALVAAGVWVVSRLVRGRAFAVSAGAVVLLGTLGFVAVNRSVEEASCPSTRGPATGEMRGRALDGRFGDEVSRGGRDMGGNEQQSQDATVARQGYRTNGWAQSNSMINRRVDNLLNSNDGSFGGELLAGVLPVALPLPAYTRVVTASRELVTRDRPFRPVLLYVTDWALLPFALLWLAAIGGLIALHRRAIAHTFGRVRARLSTPPAANSEPAPAPSSEPAPDSESAASAT